VDECAVEFGDGVGEFVFGVVGDVVGVVEADGGIDVEFGVGVQAVTDPAHADAAHAADTGPGGQGCLGGGDEFGVYGVHEPAEDVAHRGAQYRQDRHGDDEPDDGVGQWVAERDTAGTGGPRSKHGGLRPASLRDVEFGCDL
jgi:hypothetical protein